MPLCWYESITCFTCAAPFVRRWRVLLWRSNLRRQWYWPDFANLPYHLLGRWIPGESLIQCPYKKYMSKWLIETSWKHYSSNFALEESGWTCCALFAALLVGGFSLTGFFGKWGSGQARSHTCNEINGILITTPASQMRDNQVHQLRAAVSQVSFHESFGTFLKTVFCPLPTH